MNKAKNWCPNCNDTPTGSIRAHGQREPITLHEGQVLDGRNRYRACAKLKLEPATRPWKPNGQTPIQYVVSMNLHRRQLSETEREVIAAEIANATEGHPWSTRPNGLVTTQTDAAKLMHVSVRGLKRAKIAKRIANMPRGGDPKTREAKASKEALVQQREADEALAELDALRAMLVDGDTVGTCPSASEP
jgi:hypothetical protein